MKITCDNCGEKIVGEAIVVEKEEDVSMDGLAMVGVMIELVFCSEECKKDYNDE